MDTILLMMTILSMIICIGGLLFDSNYVKRKYRVIHALDLLYDHILREGKFTEQEVTEIKGLIQVAGSRANKKYCE